MVLAGAGRGFCAGHDMKEMHAHPGAAWQQGLFDACAAMMLAITRMPQPVIAHVHGVAAAAGCQLVSMCDLAVAVPEAKFALSGIHNGLFCSTPAVGVGRNINRTRAMEMLLTGDLIDAETARAWELVNRVVPGAALDAEIAKFTVAIKDGPTTVASATTAGAATSATTSVQSLVTGTTYTLTDVMASGSASVFGQYASSISCTSTASRTPSYRT